MRHTYLPRCKCEVLQVDFVLLGIVEGDLELVECLVMVLLHSALRLLVLGRVHGARVRHGGAESLGVGAS